MKHGCDRSSMASPGAGGLGDVNFEKGIVMADDPKDELGDMLADGWEVCGYTANILPMGGLCCTNRVRDSSCESSMVAGLHEQT